MRELLRTVATGKQIIALLEPEVKKGGLAIENIEAALLECDGPCQKHDATYLSKYAMWGLDAEVRAWGYEMPDAEKLRAALFEDDPIEWNRE